MKAHKHFFPGIVLAFLCTISNIAYSSKPPRCHARVGYFASRNPEKLSKKLTSKLESDSAKVAAIHCWITSNISYDFYKLKSNDFRVVNSKTILRRRGAICYGYSTLFKELCGYAGIKTVVVNGYSKHSDVDICDSFYLEDHSWNAVYIDSVWKLSDLTWDAGYFTYWRKGIKGYVLYVVSLGFINKVYYKPKFKRAPRWNYFLKSGDYFRYDHLPANPIWQLSSEITMDAYIADSSRYFFQRPRDTNTYSRQYESQREAYYNNDDTANEIDDGAAYTQFNYRNHYQCLVANNLKALPFYRELDLRSKDSIHMLELSDSIFIYTHLAESESDSNLLYLEKEHSALIRHMKTKNYLLKHKNKILKASSSKIIKWTLKGKRFHGRMNDYSASMHKINKRQLFAIIRDKRIYQSGSNGKLQSIDSIKATNKLDSLDNVLSLHYDSMRILQNNTLRIIQSLYPLLDTAIYFENTKKSTIHFLWKMRYNYNFDDFDYFIKLFRDSLLIQNKTNDSLIFTNNISILDSVHLSYRAVNHRYKKIRNLQKEKLKVLRTLKAKSKFEMLTYYLQEYNSTLNDLQNEFNAYTQWQTNSLHYLGNLGSRYSQLKSLANKSIIAIKLENRFKLKPKYIHSRYHKLRWLNTYRLRFTHIQMRRANRAKSKFSKRRK